MSDSHRRKKQPELVRRALIESAACLAVTQGPNAVTVQSVSEAAGVTKGGFMHHFPTKNELVETVFDESLTHLDQEIDLLIAQDNEPYGSFTRAYIEAAIACAWENHSYTYRSLSVLALGNQELRLKWASWYAERQERHRSTDSAPSHVIARLAADGIWLSVMGGFPTSDLISIRETLLATTMQAKRKQ